MARSLPPLALAYHGVAPVALRDDPHRLFTHPRALARHVRRLRADGYRFVTAGELARRAAEGDAAGRVALTFDDGFDDGLLDALSALGVPATVFPVSGWLGGPHPDAPGHRIVSPQRLRALHAAGVEVGAHTVTHTDLAGAGPERRRREWAESRTTLEEILQAPVLIAAYPYGAACGDEAAACAEAGLRAALRVGRGSWSDPFALPRRPMLNGSTATGLRLRDAEHYERVVSHPVPRAARRARRRVLGHRRRRLRVLLAGEAPLGVPGGAERFAVELLDALADRGHSVRALALGPANRVAAWRAHARRPPVEAVAPDPAGGGKWAGRERDIETVRGAVARALELERADIVIGQLYSGAGVVAAAREAGVASGLLLAGYEALCHWAFVTASRCVPESRCRRCPRALALPEPERRALWAVRAAEDAALRDADLLVAPSDVMAGTCERLTGRRPRVAPPVTALPRPADGRPDGHLLCAATVWSREKGVELLAPLAERLAERELLVAAPNGLPAETQAQLEALPNVEVRRDGTEMADLRDGAALVLVPSQLPEPFGRVAFEGLAAGVPTLASAAGGLAALVPAGQLVEPFDDPEAWAAAVRRLSTPAAWEAARDRGRRAATTVLGADPVGRIERWMLEAATI